MGLIDTIARFFCHRADVYEFIEESDGVVTKLRAHLLYSAIPCRLCRVSHMFSQSLDTKAEFINTLRTRAKLMTSPLYVIPPASRVVVTTHHGRHEEFEASGDVMMYSGHQEIYLYKIDAEV